MKPKTESLVGKSTRLSLPLFSRRSLIATYALSLMGFIFGGIAFFGSLIRIAFGIDGVVWNLVFLALGLILIYVATKTITLQFEIRDEGLKVRQFWQEIWIPWEELKAITAAPTFANAEHLVIRYGAKRLSLLTGFLKTPETLNKALIEVATSANRDVKLSALAVRYYGSPPYGIFKKP